MKYLKKFDQHTQYDSYIESENYIKPNVSYCEEHNNIHHSEKDPTMEYLTFTALEDGEFTLTIRRDIGTSVLSYVEYSVDDRKTWIKTDNINDTEVTIITPTVKAGENVFWRGNGERLSINSSLNYSSNFSSTCRCNVSGNIGSLVNANNPNDITYYYTFNGLFYNMTELIDASMLYLPMSSNKNISSGYYTYSNLFRNCTSLIYSPKELSSTLLPEYCYYYMFSGCVSLRTAPKLPSTLLSDFCYGYMFQNCSSLPVAPELPATTLANYCYYYMFYGCSSLTKAPDLLARTVPQHAYYYMFYGCSKLNYIKAMFIKFPLVQSSLPSVSSWLDNVASTGTIVVDRFAEWATEYTYYVPSNWTIVHDSTITEFNTQHTFTPAGYISLSHSDTIYLELVNKCTYHTIYISKDGTNWHEFQGSDTHKFSSNENCYICGNLTANGSSSNYTNIIVEGNFSLSGNCNSLWNYSDLNASLKEYCGYNLFSGCTGLTDASELLLPSTSLASYCYANMFDGCINLTNPPELPAINLASVCYEQMFRGCSSLSYAPELPSTQTTTRCYSSMFSGCTSLTEAPILNGSGSAASSCYSNMFSGCTSLVTPPPTLHHDYLNLYSYSSMFEGCTSLVNSPEILANRGDGGWNMSSMFEGCTSLQYIRIDAYENIYSSNWVKNVARTGTIVIHPLSTWETGINGIPNGWTVQINSDFISQFNPQHTFTPAGYVSFVHTNTIYVSLIKKCSYQTVYISKNGTVWHDLQTTDCIEFTSNENCYVCGNLTSAGSSNNYTNFMVGGKFSLSGNCNSLWDYNDLNTALKSYCGYNLFVHCKGITNASELMLPATTLSYECYDGMFADCTSLTTAPELPAINLSGYCYEEMFYMCSSLNYIKALFTTIPNTSYLRYWVSAVSSTGIFVKNINATWTTTGSNGVPSGWTILYFDPATEKYYLSDKTTECDDHGNPI